VLPVSSGQVGWFDGSKAEVGDILDHNWRQRGPMELHALARGLMTFVRSWLGCHSCGTSLLYHGGDVPR
jgi:hypothetical protein